MGIKRPGFQLLSLAPPELRIPLEDLDSSSPSYDDAPCLLPDQLGTYLHVYIPLLIISLIIVGISQFVSYRPRSSMKYRNDSESRGDGSRSRPTFRLTPANFRPRRDPSTESSYSSSAGGSLPRPVSGPSEKSNGFSRSSTPFLGFLARVFSFSQRAASGRLRRPRSRLKNFLYDVRDVAIYPIGIFVFITWWFS